VVICLLVGLAGTVTAAPVYWTDWTVADEGSPDTASGTAIVPGLGAVGVTFTGNFYASVTNIDNAAAINYWTGGSTAAGTYADGVIVDNGPVLPDVIALASSGTFTLTFSQPVTDPVMAVVSLGNRGLAAESQFDLPFNVVAHGAGYFGSGLFSEQAGNTLYGKEGNGTIKFIGTSILGIEWTIAPNESEIWYGFTVGIPGQGTGPGPGPGPGPTIPLPGTLLLASLGTAFVGYLHRRRTL
jgi:hypothetical protein